MKASIANQKTSHKMVSRCLFIVIGQYKWSSNFLVLLSCRFYESIAKEVLLLYMDAFIHSNNYNIT